MRLVHCLPQDPRITPRSNSLYELFSIPITEKSPIKTVKIRHSSRKLYDVFSEEAPYFIVQFPMVRKVR